MRVLRWNYFWSLTVYYVSEHIITKSVLSLCKCTWIEQKTLMNFFLFFPQIRVWTFHTNCLHRGKLQNKVKVKPLGKIWQRFQNVICYCFNLELKSMETACTLITKTCLYNFDPLKPHFYTVKLGFTWVCIIFLISAQKHRLWVLIRTASPRWF